MTSSLNSNGANPNHIKRRVLVGDGVTAAAFVESYALEQGDQLVIIGKNVNAFGRGAAYADEPVDAPWRYAYLLNSPADDIDPEFARWLERNWDSIEAKMEGRKPDWLAAAQTLLAKGDIAGVNAPRAFYGDYMEELLSHIFQKHRDNGVDIQFVEGTATAIEADGDDLVVHADNGASFYTDAVDVAPGGPETQRFDGDDTAFSAPTLFGNEARIAEHIKNGAEIFCVGTNATMLDALRLCQSLVPEEQLRFVACSPGGSLPDPLVPRLPRHLTEPNLSQGHSSAESFLSDVSKAIKAAKESGDEMREMRAGFRAFFIENGLQKFLSDQSEARAVPRTLRHWFRGGTRDTIWDFHRLAESGKTKVLEGAAFAIEAMSNGAKVLTKDKSGAVSAYETGFVINCSGASAKSAYDPLTQSMLDKGWISICEKSGGLEVGNGCESKLKNVRHLSPATTIIGDEVMPMPLYDAHLLRTWVKRAASFQG